MIQKREQILKQQLASFKNDEELYLWIIKQASTLEDYPKDLCDDDLVRGCQSTMYFICIIDKNAHFYVHSDALISKGLAALLLSVYQDMEPKEILQHQFSLLEDQTFLGLLTPSRVNGFFSLYKKIKQSLINQLTTNTCNPTKLS